MVMWSVKLLYISKKHKTAVIAFWKSKQLLFFSLHDTAVVSTEIAVTGAPASLIAADGLTTLIAVDGSAFSRDAPATTIFYCQDVSNT